MEGRKGSFTSWEGGSQQTLGAPRGTNMKLEDKGQR